ncbi:MAG: metal ABC transporter permease [Vicinamibacterales bacterium]
MTPETVALSAVVAVAAGLVGCFAVMRRMALAGDALSHVALPGIGAAMALHIDPMLGAFTMLFFGALLVWGVEDRARVATETLIGVVFSAALAVGSLIASGDNLIDALFGGGATASSVELGASLVAAAAVIAFVVGRKHALVLTLVSPDIARTAGVNVRRLNLLYLEVFALTIALGLRYLGVLLMGSLIIIPAAAAKRLSTSLNPMLVIAAALALFATVAGSLLAIQLHQQPGPLIVTIAAFCFGLTFVKGA